MEPKLVQNLTQLATGTQANTVRSDDADSSWYRALAEAWGSALDQQAQKIADMSDALPSGSENPSDLIALTAESMRMQFLSNSSSTSTNSVGSALETMARKQ
ncbi:MAG: hypothetical protein ACRBEQ_07405 [Hyphomonas sp.]